MERREVEEDGKDGEEKKVGRWKDGRVGGWKDDMMERMEGW